MGIARSRPHTEFEGEFKRSVLLIHAPDRLFHTVLDAGSWSLMRSTHLSVVRWDGELIGAERYRHAVANHHAIVYFVDPCDVLAEEVTHRMARVLCPILNNAANSEATAHVCTYGFDQHGPELAQQARLNMQQVVRSAFASATATADSAVAASPSASPSQQQQSAAGRLAVASARNRRGLTEDPLPTTEARDAVSRVRCHHLADAAAWTKVLVEVGWALLPRKVARPLGNLARDLASSCGASDVLLLDSHSFIPLVAYSSSSAAAADVASGGSADTSPDAALQKRAAMLVQPFRAMLLALNADHSQRTRGLRVSGPNGDVWLGWAAAPHAFVVVVVPRPPPSDDDDVLVLGPALVEVNMRHFAVHFENVIVGSSERTNFTPILPPD